MPEPAQVLVAVDAGVMTITLDRPARRNAWTRQMGVEVRAALADGDRRDDVRAIVVTGAGRDFCVGADVESGGAVFDESRAAQPVAPRPFGWEVRKPIIGALNGTCAGVGATLPLQWDVRLAGERTRLGFVFVRRGLVPEAASTWTLQRLVGLARATELLLTGRMVPADEALAIGLVARVVPDDDLVPAAHALAREIAEHTAPVAVALTKRLLWRMAGEGDPVAGAELELRAFHAASASPDAREGLRAFAEKRPATWTMRPSTDVPDLGIPAKKRR